MKNWIKTAAIAALAVGCVMETKANNLIVNGSFENPNQGGGWGLNNPILGWSDVSGYNPASLETGAGGIYGVTGFDGYQVMELDSTHNVVAQQTISGLNGSYSLSFLYAQRAGQSPANASFDVFWNSTLVGSFGPTLNSMTLYTKTVAGGANNTLQFVGTGTQDSYGAIIDNVSLSQVPDGGSTITFMGLGLLAVAGVRRKLS